MQCAVTHRKKSNTRIFLQRLAQDNVHSKQHMRSLFRELRWALFLRQPHFQYKCNILEEAWGIKEDKCITFQPSIRSCTFLPLLKANYPDVVRQLDSVFVGPFRHNYSILKSFVQAQMSISLLHIYIFFPGITTCPCSYAQVWTSLASPVSFSLQVLYGKIWYKIKGKNKGGQKVRCGVRKKKC